jgi:integrase
MAFVHLKPGSQFYYAYFRDATGRRRNQSTKLTDKVQAQRVAELFEQTATGKRASHHVRASFNALFEEIYAEKLPVASVMEFGELWLEAIKPEIAQSSYDAYRKTLKVFCEFLGSRAELDIINIGRRDVVAFRNHLAGKLSIDTTNRYLKIVRMIFKAAKRDSYVIENPAEDVEILKDRDNGDDARRPLTLPEIRAVLAVANPEWQSLIKFGLYTGQRLGDLGRLTFANIDLDQDVIRLVTGKTNKRLTIPIASPLRDHIESLSFPDDAKMPVHPHAFQTITETGRVVTLSNRFSELLAEIGLRKIRDHNSRGIGRDGKRERPQVSFHSLRHSAVSLLKAAGIPHATVQELIGHESEAVSRHYTHVDESALKKAADAFPKL